MMLGLDRLQPLQRPFLFVGLADYGCVRMLQHVCCIILAPDITALDREFQVTQVTLAETVSIAFSFPVSLMIESVPTYF